MAHFKTHCEDCVKELGEPFEKVHRWLDEYAIVFGPQHRHVRHHNEGIEKVRQMWGNKAAKAAEIHIRRDFDGKVPWVSEAKMFAIFNRGVHGLLEKEFPGPYED